MSKPKLALIPSGYKSGKVYSILPNDATGDFDFTRQSIGTRVRKDGLIEEAKTSGSITNELLYSEEFTGLNWANVNTTITADQELAPNGTNTANKIARTSTSVSYTAHTISKSTTSKKFTTSVYLKKGSHDYFALRTQGSYPSRVDIRFRFDTEQIYFAQAVSNFTLYDYGVEVLANDWYRLHYTYETDTHNNINVTFSPRHTDGNIDSSDSGSTAHAFVWGAMVSEGALSDYIKTEGSQETKTVETFTDVPRLDWLNSNCPSLLLEPQRTNYATNNTSMDTYSNSVFGNNPNPTQTANYTIAPDGTLTATRLQTSKTGTNYSLISFPTTSDDGSGGGYYTASVYVKSNTGSSQSIAFYGANSAPNTRTATTEWSRIQFTGQRLGNTKYAYLGTINGTDDDIDISVWGAQIELVDSYPSSLIYTGASAVTRLKDDCHLLSQTLFTDYPFTVYAKAKIEDVGNTIFSIYGGASNKYLVFLLSSSTQVAVYRRDATNNDSDFYNFTYSVGDTIKVAIAFINDTTYKLYINGTEIADVTSGLSIPFDHDDILLGQFRISADTGARNSIDDFRVYDYTLTDAELIELTK